MKYEESEKKTSSHRDMDKNVYQYQKLMKKINFDPEVSVKMRIEPDGEMMCIIFVWGKAPQEVPKEMPDFCPPIPQRIGSFIISFHQDEESFLNEFRLLINFLENKKLCKKIPISYYEMKNNL